MAVTLCVSPVIGWQPVWDTLPGETDCDPESDKLLSAWGLLQQVAPHV